MEKARTSTERTGFAAAPPGRGGGKQGASISVGRKAPGRVGESRGESGRGVGASWRNTGSLGGWDRRPPGGVLHPPFPMGSFCRNNRETQEGVGARCRPCPACRAGRVCVRATCKGCGVTGRAVTWSLDTSRQGAGTVATAISALWAQGEARRGQQGRAPGAAGPGESALAAES